MTENTNRWEQAIKKLVAKTQDDENFNWQIVSPKDYLPNVDTEGTMLIAQSDGKTLLLYRKAHYENVSSLSSAMLGNREMVKVYKAELSMFDENSKTIPYSFPSSKLNENLYNAATFKASGVESFIDNLLDDG